MDPVNFTADANCLRKLEAHKVHKDTEHFCEVDVPFTLWACNSSPHV